MSETFPAEDEEERRCGCCGARVAQDPEASEVAELGGGVEVAVPFCSDACAKAYETQPREDVEDFEDLHRAGAT
jgi:hypothetical protein